MKRRRWKEKGEFLYVRWCVCAQVKQVAKRGSHLNHRNACFRTRFRPHSCTRSVQIYSYRHTLALSSTNPLYPFSLPQLHHSLINLFSEPLCHLLYCRSFLFSLSPPTQYTPLYRQMHNIKLLLNYFICINQIRGP